MPNPARSIAAKKAWATRRAWAARPALFLAGQTPYTVVGVYIDEFDVLLNNSIGRMYETYVEWVRADSVADAIVEACKMEVTRRPEFTLAVFPGHLEDLLSKMPSGIIATAAARFDEWQELQEENKEEDC